MAKKKTSKKKTTTVKIDAKNAPNVKKQIEAKQDTKAAAEKKVRKEAVAKNVARITRVAKTLMAQLHALVVEGWDEPNAKQEALKKDIGGLQGQIASHSAEIRTLAREERTASEAEVTKIGKSLAGLERDIERWRVKLAGLKEERQGHRETMKAAMSEVRSLIKDKAEGQMRIDDPPTEPEVKPAPRSAEEVGAAVEKNATRPPSKSTESPAVEHPPISQVDTQTGEVLKPGRRPLAIAN